MRELELITKALAIQSYRYSTFRGKWTDMPNSTALCAIVGMISFLVTTAMIYIEYGLEFALVVPSIWMSVTWMFCTEDGSCKINKQLLSAVCLLMIPISLILMSLGRGHEFIEASFGLYASVAIIMLKTR